MKKLLLLLLCVPLIGLGQYKPLYGEEIRENYPKGSFCVYYDSNHNALTEGINEYDFKNTLWYECFNFSKTWFRSNSYTEVYKVDSNGNIKHIYDEIIDTNYQKLAEFYWDSKGKYNTGIMFLPSEFYSDFTGKFNNDLLSSSCWDEYGNEISCHWEQKYHKEWYDNGQLELEGNYLNGKEHGLWTSYRENGTLRYTAMYLFGKTNGLVHEYWENGNTKVLGFYKDGIRTGESRYYENRGLQYRMQYKDGERISQQCWNEQGNEIDCE